MMRKKSINLDQVLQISQQLILRSYDYLWLHTMLEQAANTQVSGSTLITGSSHALNGIQENCWNSAFNCSSFLSLPLL